MRNETNESVKNAIKQYYNDGKDIVSDEEVEEMIKSIESTGFLDKCRDVMEQQEKKRIHIRKMYVIKVACTIAVLFVMLFAFGFAMRTRHLNDIKSEDKSSPPEEVPDEHVIVDKSDAVVVPKLFYWSHPYISTNPYPACQFTITGETAYVTSFINGEADDMITGMTVYLEKYIDDSWHTYASWVHYGGRNQDNTDSIHVEHGLYRVRMTVKISLPDGYADLFDMTGNVMLFWW